ncbi:MAG: Sec-independent protein translocase protein TatB [Rhodospirillales bacterium]
MLDIGWPELFLIGVIALIVVGPKDLPRALRTVSQVVRKARSLAQEFQGGVAELVREAELDDIKRRVERSSRTIEGTIRDTVDPNGTLTDAFDPAEFNRQLKERVEGGPPTRPAPAASASDRPESVAAASAGGGDTAPSGERPASPASDRAAG